MKHFQSLNMNVRPMSSLIKTSFFLLAMVLVGGNCNVNAATIDESRKVTVSDGTQRDYWLHVPAKVKDGTYKNVPVVFALHGGSEDYQPTHSGNLNFNSLADQYHFIVVYCRGKERMFPHFNPNAARAWLATGSENEDTKYFESLIDELNNNTEGYSIDNDRIYMAGFSVGGMMTYATSNVLPHKFAAFASISGLPMNEVHLRQHGSRPVPFLHVHGTKDAFVRFSHMPTIVDNMLNRSGISYTPDEVKTGKAYVWGDGNTTYKKSVYGKDTTTPYIFYQIGTGSGSSDKGMGHNHWCSIDDKDVQVIMWDFLSKYRLSDERNTDVEFKADVNTENSDASAHGWTVNYGDRTLVKYGQSGGYSSSTQNVYHTIQLNAGTHYLKYKTANAEDGQYVNVRLVKLGALKNFDQLMGNSPSGNYFMVTSSSIINNVSYGADNKQTVIEFTTKDAAEYMLVLQKGNKTDKTTVSEIEITKTGVPTTNSISILSLDNDKADVYDLAGRKKNAGKSVKGVYVTKSKKFIAK